LTQVGYTRKAVKGGGVGSRAMTKIGYTRKARKGGGVGLRAMTKWRQVRTSSRVEYVGRQCRVMGSNAWHEQ
jgi:hypothetical protein